MQRDKSPIIGSDYDNARATLMLELVGQVRLWRGSEPTEEEMSRWSGYIDALEDTYHCAGCDGHDTPMEPLI